MLPAGLDNNMLYRTSGCELRQALRAGKYPFEVWGGSDQQGESEREHIGKADEVEEFRGSINSVRPIPGHCNQVGLWGKRQIKAETIRGVEKTQFWGGWGQDPAVTILKTALLEAVGCLSIHCLRASNFMMNKC